MSLRPVLVTGGAGFVGKNLVSRLQSQGRLVRILDHSEGALASVPSSKDRTLTKVDGDIRSYEEVKAAMRGVAGVVHLAAVSGVPYSMQAPDITAAVNVQGTLNVARAAAECKVERLVYYSSAAVYGKVSHPVSEDEPKRPISVYGATKLAGEELLFAYQRLGKIDCVILRPFNIYGSGDTKSVLFRFMQSARAGRPLVINGSGKQTRDFVNVSDVVSATIKALETDGIGGKVFNVGSGKPTSILALARMVGESMERRSFQILHHSALREDLPYSCADPSRARRALGFTAKVDLAAWLKSNAGPVKASD